MVPAQAHNLNYGGSNPPPATNCLTITKDFNMTKTDLNYLAAIFLIVVAFMFVLIIPMILVQETSLSPADINQINVDNYNRQVEAQERCARRLGITRQELQEREAKQIARERAAREREEEHDRLMKPFREARERQEQAKRQAIEILEKSEIEREARAYVEWKKKRAKVMKRVKELSGK